jgi:hypothetical protein
MEGSGSSRHQSRRVKESERQHLQDNHHTAANFPESAHARPCQRLSTVYIQASIGLRVKSGDRISGAAGRPRRRRASMQLGRAVDADTACGNLR